MMQRQKSVRNFNLTQLIEENFNLNTSQSASLLNQSSYNHNNVSQSFTTNKILPMNYDQSTININRKNNQDSNAKLKKNYFNYKITPSSKQQTTTLIKSKQMLQKFTTKLSSLAGNNNSKNKQSPPTSSLLPIEIVKTQIYETTFQINKQLEKKIQNNFAKLLNRQTVMPIAQIIHQERQIKEQQQNDNGKQNSGQNVISLNQGTKLLMTQYWEKKQQQNIQTPKNKQKSKHLSSSKISQNNKKIILFSQTTNLPKINQKAYGNIPPTNRNQNIILGKISKNQKKREELLRSKDEELKLEFYSFIVEVIDFKIQNQSKEFLLFQRLNFKKWHDVSILLQCIQKFCNNYSISQAKINLKKVLQLQQIGSKRVNLRQAFYNQQQARSSTKDLNNKSLTEYTKIQYSTHQILNCFQDAEKISQTHTHSKGIRFFGHKGKKRAIVKIQAHFRRYLCKKRFQNLKKIISKVILIQKTFRSYMNYSNTKQKIVQIQMQKIKKFNQLKANFKQNYRKNQLTKKIKYQIHLCSLSSTQWQRVTTQNIDQRQNTQLSRIFRIATKTTPLIQTRIIYIAPNQLPKDIVNYYKKIFEFGSQSSLQKNLNQIGKLNILWPENVDKLPQTLTLTQKLLYSRSTMKRLKRLVKGNYCYIVPSMPSNDFISLSYELNVPLYSSEPQKLLYLQTKSGLKQFAEILKQSKQQDSFGILPYSMNIYNKTSFINELTFLVYNYPSVRRWILKIDHQHNSRGLAYIDTSKILKSQLIKQLIQSPSQTNQKLLKQQIHNKLYQTLITFKQQKIIPLSKQIYRSQQQYLNHFLSNGGIIQASINNFESQLENDCFVIEIEPDGQWKFLSSYYKITNKNKTVGCYYDSSSEMQPPIQIQIMVKQLIRRKLFGFFTFQFLKIASNNNKINSSSSNNFNKQKNTQNLTYFNGIQCHLSDLSSACFLKQFLSKDTNVLYIPFLPHPSLKQLRIQTFFHLCRLQNISFDIQRKIGNVFMFLNGLESGCMGLMSFNQMSKQQTFQQVSDVLDFLSSKLCQSNDLVKKLPKSFMAVRNVVNGFLKKDRNFRLSKQIRNSTSASMKSLKGYRSQDRIV